MVEHKPRAHADRRKAHHIFGPSEVAEVAEKPFEAWSTLAYRAVASERYIAVAPLMVYSAWCC